MRQTIYKVNIGPRTYSMGKNELDKLLEVAREQIPRGIYAVRKGNYVELCREKLTKTQLKIRTREYKALGFVVYANK